MARILLSLLVLTDLGSAGQAQKRYEITRGAGPLICFSKATNDKPHRIDLNVANCEVDLKGKLNQVQAVAKDYRRGIKVRRAMAGAIVKLTHNPQLVQLYRLGNHHLRY